MIHFDWLNTKEVDEFACSLVDDLVRRLPPPAANSEKEWTPHRLRDTHDVIFARVEKFARTHRLNVFKKARLGNTFKWTLSQAGYEREFVDSLTYDIVTLISSKKRTP